ncbi:MAG: helix-turn-helix domain-containing protein [Sphingobium sp.]|uniref:winged helix-turn-helix transcriptional regulator n=1 Tax=Sphingobium sp. TaxID=1912891 RepID=UPI0029B3DE88|nr:helix-turn-helix domain-containing protein [Sphingobium sp.]MDX3911658.1 helix-turn-helix domain-containing protein [Sphingobium sp.]
MKKRAYSDGCAAAHALDLIGDRWAIPVMREMLLGARRFSDIRTALPGLSANVLTQRLEELEAASIVQRRKLPPPASVQVYELTQWGLESEGLIKALGRWASRSPHKEPGPMSPVSVILSMRTMFSADRAGDMRATIGLHFGPETYRAEIAGGAITVDRGEIDDVDALFSGDQNALIASLYGGVPLGDVSDRLTATGNPDLIDHFMHLFPLPPAAPDLHKAQ